MVKISLFELSFRSPQEYFIWVNTGGGNTFLGNIILLTVATQWVDTYTPAFVTFKEHKENFRSSHPCRFINSSKSELGKVSKAMSEKVNTILVDFLKVNQWIDTDMVINWFNAIKNKSQCCFIQLDIA